MRERDAYPLPVVAFAGLKGVSEAVRGRRPFALQFNVHLHIPLVRVVVGRADSTTTMPASNLVCFKPLACRDYIGREVRDVHIGHELHIVSSFSSNTDAKISAPDGNRILSTADNGFPPLPTADNGFPPLPTADNGFPSRLLLRRKHLLGSGIFLAQVEANVLAWRDLLKPDVH